MAAKINKKPKKTYGDPEPPKEKDGFSARDIYETVKYGKAKKKELNTVQRFLLRIKQESENGERIITKSRKADEDIDDNEESEETNTDESTDEEEYYG